MRTEIPVLLYKAPGFMWSTTKLLTDSNISVQATIALRNLLLLSSQGDNREEDGHLKDGSYSQPDCPNARHSKHERRKTLYGARRDLGWTQEDGVKVDGTIENGE
jgi:hypothetical protein